MRHRVDHRKLNRTSSHRRAMLRNMVTSLFDKERITTTDAKAKEARRYAERLITRAKKGYSAYQEMLTLREEGKEEEAMRMEGQALAHWRQAGRFIQKKNVLKKLFNDLAPLYLERDGGYTRILRLDSRLGDNAKTVMLELVGTAITSQPRVKKPRKKKEEEAAEGVEGAGEAQDEKGMEAEGEIGGEVSDVTTEADESVEPEGVMGEEASSDDSEKKASKESSTNEKAGEKDSEKSD